MDYALEWNGYFIYKNPDGEDVMILTTNPEIKELRAAPAVWLRKRSQSIEHSELQVQGFAASVISLAINHYWHIRNYSKEDNPFSAGLFSTEVSCLGRTAVLLIIIQNNYIHKYLKSQIPVYRAV